MRLSTPILFVFATTVVGVISKASRPRHSRQYPMCCADDLHIKTELGPRLSGGALISVASSAEWESLMLRATSPRVKPSFVASIEPAIEEDVQETVRYANEHGVPFLAVTGTHGWDTTMNELNCGIQINMRRMNSTQLHAEAGTATIGGGTMQYEAVLSLYEQGRKAAVTGLCECVSVIGPLMGGGHSMLQGRHGFAADNLVSARVILANGSAITVSETQHPDLFWSIRGAGHNFGVVTSFDVKVHDVAPRWTMMAFAFTQDKLEDYFRVWNQLEAEYHDAVLVLNGIFARVPDLDPNHPVINLQFFYDGENPVVDAYAAAFRALGPVLDTVVADIEYKDLYRVGGLNMDSPVCRKNENIAGFPVSFDKFNATAMLEGFSIFSELTADARFATSIWLLESYGRNEVRDIPLETNAIAPEERTLHILASPILWWKGEDLGDRETAYAHGRRMQEAMRSGSSSPPHTYVNYAVGKERLSEVYGHDDTRIRRLQWLKAVYDPENRFGYYSPLSL